MAIRRYKKQEMYKQELSTLSTCDKKGNPIREIGDFVFTFKKNKEIGEALDVYVKGKKIVTLYDPESYNYTTSILIKAFIEGVKFILAK